MRATSTSKPWETLEPALDFSNIYDMAKMYKIDSVALMAWYTAFTVTFRHGPDAFIPWYLQQISRWEHGLMRFKPFAPEAIYPSLGKAEWLFGHPYWRQGGRKSREE